MSKIFITGSTGFVGKCLIDVLKKTNSSFTAGSRELYSDIAEFNRWDDLLKGHSSVVHLAARVHVMNDRESDPLSSFRKMNVEATLKLAKSAKAMGVKRFIFLSSIKVNGEETSDTPYLASDVPSPKDPYGISKWEAEIELMKLHEKDIFEVVIIRPPLIYGKGVKANFQSLFSLVSKKIPLPFGRVENKRSLVSVLNLCDLIVHCIDHPKAAGEIFLVSDDHDYSLAEIIQRMGNVLKMKPLLINFPVFLIRWGLIILGKRDYANRLLGNLHVDIEKTKTLLDWKPKYSFEDTFK